MNTVLKGRPRWLFQNVQSAALPALIENASQNVPSVMARDDATIKLGDVNRPGCVSIVIELTVASSLRSHRFGRGAGRCRSVAFDGSTVVTKRDPV